MNEKIMMEETNDRKQATKPGDGSNDDGDRGTETAETQNINNYEIIQDEAKNVLAPAATAAASQNDNSSDSDQIYQHSSTSPPPTVQQPQLLEAEDGNDHTTSPQSPQQHDASSNVDNHYDDVEGVVQELEEDQQQTEAQHHEGYEEHSDEQQVPLQQEFKQDMIQQPQRQGHTLFTLPTVSEGIPSGGGEEDVDIDVDIEQQLPPIPQSSPFASGEQPVTSVDVQPMRSVAFSDVSSSVDDNSGRLLDPSISRPPQPVTNLDDDNMMSPQPGLTKMNSKGADLDLEMGSDHRINRVSVRI